MSFHVLLHKFLLRLQVLWRCNVAIVLCEAYIQNINSVHCNPHVFFIDKFLADLQIKED